MSRGAVAILVVVVLTAPGAGEAYAASLADWPDYRLAATLDPTTHRLAIVAEVTLANRPASGSVDFLLGSNFVITSASPPVSEVPGPVDGQGFSGINGTSAAMIHRRGVSRYRVRAPSGVARLHLEYSGLVDGPPAASPEEYARSFAETPGIVSSQGVYLAGTTAWYPQLAGGGLLTYSLTVNTPPGWRLIGPGEGVPTGVDGVARWASAFPLDEISVAGGPLTPYTAKTGAVEAQVYLRQPDPALAATYLEATGRFLRMYGDLLGAYPYGKFALVENFWETGYGMPSYTLLGPQVIRLPFILTSSYPHEILHNWWGNSVFVDYATGNWCEGLTAYLADHLMKEVEGQGAEYRRDVLKKYRDFASANADFPLREFRTRNSGATEAVGYGKALMGFHRLRQQLGDAVFRKALERFYRDYGGRRAGFADLQKVFEAESGADLSRFFDELTGRAGAAELAVEGVRVQGRAGDYAVSGVLRQRQGNARTGAFDLEVPVVVQTEAGPVMARIRSRDQVTPFTITTPAEPELLAVDPEFDVFRILDPRETAPAIGQFFGAPRVTAVLPAVNPVEAAAWLRMLEAWQSPSRRIDVVTDAEAGVLPAGRPVWLLGRGNRLAGRVFTDDLPEATGSGVQVRRHPADPRLAVGWITAETVAAIPGLGRKLPHYGKYSWLTFAGDEPVNTGKGEWPATDSPLLVSLKAAGTAPAQLELPRRRPLAEPPPVYSVERLLGHVRYLAAPEREGRGFGSAGLAAAAEYIRDQFAAAGLRPGGEQGGFFQSFAAVGGPDGRSHRLRNVIGVLPGANPRFRDQAALLTAHYDHLGYGWPGARVDAIGKLHPGADDNASGVAVLLEVARQLAAGSPPPRTVVFVAFSGEEAGRVGSRHYVREPLPVPAGGLFGVVNLDTVGRLGEQPVSILGAESAREWPFVFSGITAVTGVRTRTIPGASQSSDQQSFIDGGIPAIQLFTAATADYHRPTDTPDKIDGAGLSKVAVVASEAIGYLASTEQRLSVTGRQPAPATAGAGTGPGAGEGRRVSLGAIPDFAFPGPGVRLEGVVPGSPADKAGLQAGDVLRVLDGKPVLDLAAFNQLLRGQRPGDRVRVAWSRAGEEIQAEVTLVER